MDPRAQQSETLNGDLRIRGIWLFTLSVFLINIMNALSKHVSDVHAPLEIVFYRGAIALVLLVVWAAIRGRLFTLHQTARPWSHFGRSLFGNIGLLLVIWSFALLPMADATATLFASSMIVTILSATILKEHVGPWRWGAVIVGFSGILMIVQPTHAMMHNPAALVPLGAAFSGALVQIYLRDLGRSEDSLTTVFYFLLLGLLVGGVYMPFGGQFLTGETWLPMIALAVCGLVSLIVKTYAYSLAEASLLSPFQYTAILWATLFGWLFWGDVPTLTVTAGAAIIIASNLVILWRERLQKIRMN